MEYAYSLKLMQALHNFKLKIAYDGSQYLGWQKTPAGPSIEDTLQRALEEILQEPIQLQAASRTDAGVHARGQIVNFFTSQQQIHLTQINALLPNDIVILSTERANLKFHPTLDCIGKCYHYKIALGPVCLPEHRQIAWHFPYPVDMEKLHKATKHFIGVHDFAAFCNIKKNETYENTIREVKELCVKFEEPNLITIKISGNHFLYKMVRNIVGTLVWAAAGKIDSASIPAIILKKDRTLAGVTAPSQGLVLHEVFYPHL
jgi:tRNA pseudouridine38-40 synthase